MDTAPLKSFATWARTSLIREVTARIGVVLAPASPQRVEQPKAVAALENAITAAGAGDKGRGAVADRVAYTWFNRIIALRFMDANGYTGIGVVSPQAGAEVGQPEILAEAKRANIDSEVVGEKVRDAVTGLLNGSRRSGDPQGEAYSLLLAEYCRHWNRSMPFMFERQGDFTELLIPVNLLADDSVINRSLKVLTEDVCQDVEAIGWLYQFYISERKDEVFASFKRNKKAGAEEIPAATQLFTPHWIVRYLVENSLGRLWMLNRPTSRLVDKMDYYIAPVDVHSEVLKVSTPEEIKFIDPACGSGHMLSYAFDLLFSIYEEDGYPPSEIPSLILSKNLYGTEIDVRAGALAAFALTMKARARQRTFLSKCVEPNICVLEPISFDAGEIETLLTSDGERVAEEAFWRQFEDADMIGALISPDESLISPLERHLDGLPALGEDIFGSELRRRADCVLRQARYLTRRYQVVVANPPYMNAKNMNAKLADWLKTHYADVKADLFASFIVRNSRLAVEGGHMGFMTPFVWMFIPTYDKLRKYILSHTTITSLVQLEYSGFEGATVPICAFTLENSQANTKGVYIRLSDFKGATNQAPRTVDAVRDPSVSWRFVASSEDFLALPGSPIAYWLSPATRKAFRSEQFIGDISNIREGINTGNNVLFLRRWWEVSHRRITFDRTRDGEHSQRWVPHRKGGAFRRWSGNEEYVLDWGGSGEDIHAYHNVPLTTNGAPMRGKAFFFRPAISWSRVSSSEFSIRFYAAGFSYDSTAPSIFGQESDLKRLLGLLNSVVVSHLLQALSPTLDFRITALSRIPLPADWSLLESASVDRLIELARRDWDTQETSWGFGSTPWTTNDVGDVRLADHWKRIREDRRNTVLEAQALEEANNRVFLESYELSHELDSAVGEDQIALNVNDAWEYSNSRSTSSHSELAKADAVRDLVSYAVGCMFGRYSLDVPGLVLADQEANIRAYFEQVPTPTFVPDQDNVIPIVDGDWFEDDIVARFRRFLRTAFGESHFEENLRFVTEALGVKDLREYFIRSFFLEHTQRYRKHPIYWLFSSPKGSFNALIYMHRYTPSTVSTVLNEYLREFRAKLAATLGQQERLAIGGGTPRQQAAAQKEADRIRKMLLELDEYEHDVLYPLASQQIEIDLDDGVRVNYPKFGAALKKIPGLEAAE